LKERKEKALKKAPEAKGMTPDERKRLLREGIKKTAVPAFIAVAFALLFILTAEKITGRPWFLILLLVIFVSYYFQKIIYPYIGVRVNEFETKDWIYVHFLVIIYLLVFWTILLN
jgi:hypothetical protein